METSPGEMWRIHERQRDAVARRHLIVPSKKTSPQTKNDGGTLTVSAHEPGRMPERSTQAELWQQGDMHSWNLEKKKGSPKASFWTSLLELR